MYIMSWYLLYCIFVQSRFFYIMIITRLIYQARSSISGSTQPELHRLPGPEGQQGQQQRLCYP